MKSNNGRWVSVKWVIGLAVIAVIKHGVFLLLKPGANDKKEIVKKNAPKK